MRRVEVIAPNFSSVGGLVVGTNRIATIHRLLAVRMAEYLPLKLLELPFEMPAVRESAQWSSRSANDPAIAWLVGLLKQIAAQLRSKSGAPRERITPAEL